MNKSSFVAGAATAAFVILAGCATDDADRTLSGGDAGTGATTSPDTPPDTTDVSRAERARVAVVVTGDLTFEWEGERGIQIVTLAPYDQRDVHLFSVGFMDFAPMPDAGAGHFRWAFDVTGGYDGAGEYRIRGDDEPEPDSDNPAAGVAGSGAMLIHGVFADPDHEPLADPSNVEAVTSYQVLIQGCTVTVSDHERTGSLTCPALGNGEGGQIGLRVTWELIGT